MTRQPEIPVAANADAGATGEFPGPVGHQQVPAPGPGARPWVSLNAVLRGREQVAQAARVLTEVVRVGADEAEALLISEADRRGVPTAVVARIALGRPEAAKGWRVLRCSLCGGVGLLRVFGEYKLVRVLACPEGHGVICRG